MQGQENFGIIIIAGCLAMLFVIASAITLFLIYKRRVLENEARIREIEHQKQIESFIITSEAEEKEREKIARNIHDGIIPILSAIETSLGKNYSDIDTPQFDKARFGTDISRLKKGIKDLREVSHDIIPTDLRSFGVIVSLSYFFKELQAVGNVKIDFEDRTGYRDKPPFSMPAQLNIYRICLEILNNLQKHSGYSYLKVIAEQVVGALEIEFMHNGKGITTAEIDKLIETGGGIGLNSLRSRSILLGASIDYSIDGEAAIVNISIPIKSIETQPG